LVTDPSILNDAFLILHAGFAAALYKVVGTDFGAQLLERVVQTFDTYRAPSNSGGDGKQQLNLIAFLSSLYAFQVVGSAIMFDYIRLLLSDITEEKAELLLRVLRTSGTQLRSDDPTALKDIVVLLQRNVAAQPGGEAGLSVRAQFMIETIRDLKNNRGIKAGALAAEHTTKMRKVLGTLSTRSVRATEPLRVTLDDIRDSEKKGKWWLVGASYHDPAKLASNNIDSKGSKPTALKQRPDDADAGYESETPGHTNLTRAARAQGMNTDIRRLIFINIVGADDYLDAWQRLQGLKLKTKQKVEIPRVLLHCVGVEGLWNPFYALVAGKVCEGDGRAMGKGFQYGLWETIKKLTAAADGGSDDDGDDDGEDGSTSMSLQKTVNLAKFFAHLLASSSVPISALKTLDFALLLPNTKAYVFADVLLTTTFLQIRKIGKKDGFADKTRDIFATAARAPQMIEGLQHFLRSVVSAAGLTKDDKEKRTVREGCEVALEALSQAAEMADGPMDDEDDVSD
jgi:nucleolar MIF4G domain-containing protein 1